MNADAPTPRRLPRRLIVGVFAALFALLALGYLLFLRTDYVPVFSELRPSDASAIVAQLDGKHIPYRTSDGGTTILVPDHQADAARLAIAGSDVPLKGGVGFELFNRSDMGLTDFAQRINYQRALQGELERSIMMIDEVATARVHLAMPERTIFRSERRSAKAAVEISVRPGRQFDAPRVAGVQRLVAFAVPDLSPADVVVLGSDGRLLSQAAGNEAVLPPDVEERQGVQGYYRARARAALAQTLPGAQTDVRIVVLGEGATEFAASGAAAATATPAGGPSPADLPGRPARSFDLRVIVATATPLNDEETALARNAIVAALDLDVSSGDELSFRVGLPSQAPAAAARPLGDPAPDAVGPVPIHTPDTVSWPLWAMGAAILLILGGVLALRSRRRRPRLNAEEREAMVRRIRAALHPSGDGHAAA